jgi:hypothetical protein
MTPAPSPATPARTNALPAWIIFTLALFFLQVSLPQSLALRDFFVETKLIYFIWIGYVLLSLYVFVAKLALYKQMERAREKQDSVSKARGKQRGGGKGHRKEKSVGR